MTRVADYLLASSNCYGSITIDGVAMNCPAWTLPDLSALWGTEDVRGADRLIPGTAGVKPYQRRATVTHYSLPFLVTGQVTVSGGVNADPYQGLQTNMAYLQSNVLQPTGTGDGTRTLVWTLPSGATVTSHVHVLGLANPQLQPLALLRATLEISSPHGDLHL